MPYFAQCTKRNERWGVNTYGPDALYAEKKRSVVFVVLGLELHENLPLSAKKSAVRSRLECPNSGPGGGRSKPLGGERALWMVNYPEVDHASGGGGYRRRRGLDEVAGGGLWGGREARGPRGTALPLLVRLHHRRRRSPWGLWEGEIRPRPKHSLMNRTYKKNLIKDGEI